MSDRNSNNRNNKKETEFSSSRSGNSTMFLVASDDSRGTADEELSNSFVQKEDGLGIAFTLRDNDVLFGRGRLLLKNWIRLPASFGCELLQSSWCTTLVVRRQPVPRATPRPGSYDRLKGKRATSNCAPSLGSSCPFRLLDLWLAGVVLSSLWCDRCKGLVPMDLLAMCVTEIWFAPSWWRRATYAMTYHWIAISISMCPIIVRTKMYPHHEEIEFWRFKLWKQSNLAKEDFCNDVRLFPNI